MGAEIGGVIIMSQNAWRVLCEADFDPARALFLSDWSSGAPVFYGFGKDSSPYLPVSKLKYNISRATRAIVLCMVSRS
jgi:hypothetical protein